MSKAHSLNVSEDVQLSKAEQLKQGYAYMHFAEKTELEKANAVLAHCFPSHSEEHILTDDDFYVGSVICQDRHDPLDWNTSFLHDIVMCPVYSVSELHEEIFGKQESLEEYLESQMTEIEQRRMGLTKSASFDTIRFWIKEYNEKYG